MAVFNMIGLGPAPVLEPFGPAEEIQADTWSGLLETWCPGYGSIGDDIGRLLARASTMGEIAARLQAFFAFNLGPVPDWVVDRSMLEPVEVTVWNERCPLIVLTDVQDGAGRVVPAGNVVPLCFTDDRLFVESLARCGLVQVWVNPDADSGADELLDLLETGRHPS